MASKTLPVIIPQSFPTRLRKAGMPKAWKIQSWRFVTGDVYRNRLKHRERAIIAELDKMAFKGAVNLFQRFLAESGGAGGTEPISWSQDSISGESKSRVITDLDTGIANVTRRRFRVRVKKYLQERSGVESILSSHAESDAFLVEDEGIADTRIRAGVLHYPPFTGFNDSDQPIGIYKELCDSLQRQGSDVEFIQRRVELEHALRSLTGNGKAPDAIDCLFGIFDSPGRAAVQCGEFFGPTHFISLVGVTRKDSRIRTLNDITTDKSFQICYVQAEIGAEFVERSLNIPRDSRARTQVATVENVGEVLDQVLKTDRDRIAFLDGVSAKRYLKENPRCDKELSIRFNHLMWYACGMFLRRGAAARRIKSQLRDSFAAARMNVWHAGNEQRLLQGLYNPKRPEGDVVRPILYPSSDQPSWGTTG